MITLTFQSDDGLRLGVKTDQGIIDVKAAAAALGESAAPTSPDALISGGNAAMSALSDFVARASSSAAGAAWLLDESSLTLGPCAPKPGKIICVGLNYRRHAEEGGNPIPETPVMFPKYQNSIAAPNEQVPLPANGVEYDYEVELAFVVGQRARHVSEADALDYVLGYCNANDLSERALQMRTSQWMLGKALDKFLPVGPYLMTGDEIGDPQNLSLKTWVNGELRQNSNTSDMIFTVAEIISYISDYLTLEAGDLIITGTPEGVILGMKEKVWLKAGDEVTVEVGNLGRLTNTLVGE